MAQCQFLFSAVFCFRKAIMEIFSESDETKSQMPIFPDTFQKYEEETKEGTEAPSQGGGAAPPSAAPTPRDGPSGLHRLRPFAYKYPPT